MSLLKSPFLREGKGSIEEILEACFRNLRLCERARDVVAKPRSAGLHEVQRLHAKIQSCERARDGVQGPGDLGYARTGTK